MNVGVPDRDCSEGLVILVHVDPASGSCSSTIGKAVDVVFDSGETSSSNRVERELGLEWAAEPEQLEKVGLEKVGLEQGALEQG